MMTYLKEILAFVLALIAAYFYHWNTTDLIWSFWTASFTIGFSIIYSETLGRAFSGFDFLKDEKFMQKSAQSPAVLRYLIFSILILFGLIGPIFMAGFFTVHFGGFHLGHSVFLMEFFPHPGILENGQFWLHLKVNGPATGDVTPLGFFHDLGILFKDYWFIVLVTAFYEFNWLEKLQKSSQLKPTKKDHSSKRRAPNFTAPYAKVVKIHILIFVLAGFQAAKVEGFLVYAVVFFFFFFPFGKLFSWKKNPSK